MPRQLGGRAEDGHAVHAAAAQPRVVVDEADDALAGRLAQLAHQAAAGAAGADDQRRAGPARSRTDSRPSTSARSAKREAAISDRAEQRVDDEERAREVAERLRASR